MKCLPDQPTSNVSITLIPCHPERSPAESEANRQTQSKDPAPAVSATGNSGNFRVVIRFHDEQGTELFLTSSREAAVWDSPARKCRVSREDQASPVGMPQPISINAK